MSGSYGFMTGLLSLGLRDRQISHGTLTLCSLQWQRDILSKSPSYQAASNVCPHETCLGECSMSARLRDVQL